MALTVEGNPDTRGELQFVYDSIRSDQKDLVANIQNATKKEIDDAVLDEVNSNYGRTLNNYHGFTTSDFQKIVSPIQRLGYVYSRTEKSAEAAAKRANNTYLDGHYTYGTFHGATVRMPKSFVSRDAARATIQMINDTKNADLLVPEKFLPEIEGKAFRLKKYREALSGLAIPATLHDNTGIQLLDPFANPVLRKDGSLFFIKYSEMADPSSEFRQKSDATVLGQEQIGLNLPERAAGLRQELLTTSFPSPR